MNLYSLIITAHIFLCLCIIGLVLVQHGKGADAGAAFGSGASGTVFGASGSANFFSTATKMIAIAVLATSLGITYISNHGSGSGGGSVLDKLPVSDVPEAVSAEAPVDAVPQAVMPAVTPDQQEAVPAAVKVEPAVEADKVKSDVAVPDAVSTPNAQTDSSVTTEKSK